MGSVDGEGDGRGEELRPAEQRPEEQPPVVHTLLPDHTEQNHRLHRECAGGTPDAGPGGTASVREWQGMRSPADSTPGESRPLPESSDTPPEGPRVPSSGVKFIEKSVLFPVNTSSRRSSFFNRACSRELTGAFSNPTIATTMPLSLMKWISASKIGRRIVVEPDDESALHLQVRPSATPSHSPIMSRPLFGIFLHSSRLPGFGLSIPTNTSSNPARATICSRSGSSARLSDASVPSENG